MSGKTINKSNNKLHIGNGPNTKPSFIGEVDDIMTDSKVLLGTAANNPVPDILSRPEGGGVWWNSPIDAQVFNGVSYGILEDKLIRYDNAGTISYNYITGAIDLHTLGFYSAANGVTYVMIYDKSPNGIGFSYSDLSLLPFDSTFISMSELLFVGPEAIEFDSFNNDDLSSYKGVWGHYSYNNTTEEAYYRNGYNCFGNHNIESPDLDLGDDAGQTNTVLSEEIYKSRFGSHFMGDYYGGGYTFNHQGGFPWDNWDQQHDGYWNATNPNITGSLSDTPFHIEQIIQLPSNELLFQFSKSDGGAFGWNECAIFKANMNIANDGSSLETLQFGNTIKAHFAPIEYLAFPYGNSDRNSPLFPGFFDGEAYGDDNDAVPFVVQLAGEIEYDNNSGVVRMLKDFRIKAPGGANIGQMIAAEATGRWHNAIGESTDSIQNAINTYDPHLFTLNFIEPDTGMPSFVDSGGGIFSFVSTFSTSGAFASGNHSGPSLAIGPTTITDLSGTTDGDNTPFSNHFWINNLEPLLSGGGGIGYTVEDSFQQAHITSEAILPYVDRLFVGDIEKGVNYPRKAIQIITDDNADDGFRINIGISPEDTNIYKYGQMIYRMGTKKPEIFESGMDTEGDSIAQNRYNDRLYDTACVDIYLSGFKVSNQSILSLDATDGLVDIPNGGLCTGAKNINETDAYYIEINDDISTVHLSNNPYLAKRLNDADNICDLYKPSDVLLPITSSGGSGSDDLMGSDVAGGGIQQTVLNSNNIGNDWIWFNAYYDNGGINTGSPFWGFVGYPDGTPGSVDGSLLYKPADYSFFTSQSAGFTEFVDNRPNYRPFSYSFLPSNGLTAVEGSALLSDLFLPSQAYENQIELEPVPVNIDDTTPTFTEYYREDLRYIYQTEFNKIYTGLIGGGTTEHSGGVLTLADLQHYTSSDTDGELLTISISAIASTSGADKVFIAPYTVSYKMTFTYDGFQETPLCVWKQDDSEESTDRAGYNVTVKFNPQTFNKRITHINIYRRYTKSDGTGDTFYQLVDSKTLRPITQFTSIDDNRYQYLVKDLRRATPSYSSVTGISETLPHTYINYGLSTVSDSYLFVSDADIPYSKGDFSHYIFRSMPNGRFSQFNWPVDNVRVPDKITAMESHNGRLYAFSDAKTFLINIATLELEDVYLGAGCVNKNSIISTEYGLCYADNNNIYLINDSGPQVISRSISTRSMSSIEDDSNRANPIPLGWQDHNKRFINVSFDQTRKSFLIFFSTFLGNTPKDFCWAYNILRQRWDLLESPGKVLGSYIGKNGSINLATDRGFYTFLDPSNKLYKSWTWHSKDLVLTGATQSKKFRNLKVNSDKELSDSSVVIALDRSVTTEELKHAQTSSKGVIQKETKIKGKNSFKMVRVELNEVNGDTEVDTVGIVYTSKRAK